MADPLSDVELERIRSGIESAERNPEFARNPAIKNMRRLLDEVDRLRAERRIT